MPRLAIMIPTYRRVHLLIRLIEDITHQSVVPEYLVVVDGDPGSGEVLEKLKQVNLPHTRIIYVPSNHGNVAYQRYLGWRVAKEEGAGVILYFDDDLRLPGKDALEKIIEPFSWENSGVVGVTAWAVPGDLSKHEGTEVLLKKESTPLQRLAQKIGAQKNLPPGALSRTGRRVMPERKGQEPYAHVEWLQGRVMAYDMAKFTQDCFSDSLFALYHVKGGFCEDTFMSRYARSKGELLMAYDTQIQHPDDDTPKAYPYQARKFAYAVAYSRRFLNDHYRVFERPTFSDNFELVRNYSGTALLRWIEALLSFRRYRYAYAWGYTLGAIRGLVQEPTAHNLTPNIDWWGDADKAVAQKCIV